MRYRRTRRDANHKSVVDALRGLGAIVVDTAAVGGGFPDVVIGYRGRTWLAEIKNPERKTRGDNASGTLAKQADFRAAWRGAPVLVVETVEEALRAVQGAEAEV